MSDLTREQALWVLRCVGGKAHRSFINEQTRDALQDKGFIKSSSLNWIEITPEGREALEQWEKENAESH